MSQSQSAEPTATAATQFATGWRWARAGWEQFLRDVPFWLGMAALYVIPAILLMQIPFAGSLVIVLLSPMMLAGALLAAGQPVPARAAPGVLQRWVERPAAALVRAVADPAHVYPVVLLGMITLGLVVLVFILEHLLGVSALSSLRSSTARGAVPVASLAAGLLVAALLQILLLMALFYAVHRTLLSGRDPLNAVGDSFRACTRHGWALAGLASVYVLPYLVIVGAFAVSSLLGYLLLCTAGVILLPALVLASYHSYREIFPASP